MPADSLTICRVSASAQRVSDYNNIHREDIEAYTKRSIVDVPDPENPGKTKPIVQEKEITVINIKQKKTGAKVAIPCSPDLIRILEKYHYDIPHLSDQNINDNIKEIARLAGLTDKVRMTTTKGGRVGEEWVEKYKLVHSHTARRTGATLMYLAGMDIYDIMKITGHSTPVMLKKYIKADGILHTLCGESDIYSVLVSSAPIRMSWSHYRTLLQVSDDNARLWYENETIKQTWSVRTLQRNISSQYYYRLLQSPAKEKVEAEMKSLTAPLQDKLEYMKNPVVAEFLGFHNNTDYSESDLEQSILDHLPQFLMEMGKGFAFVDRQKHIQTEKKDYYIDLVFYNYLLKCFVLVDLKTTTVDYQDAGQMKMYVSMYDEKYRSEGDNPTIGILLCADTDEDVAKYSSLHDNDQLYMAKYLTYMPTQEQMRREIEQQKMIFELKQGK